VLLHLRSAGANSGGAVFWDSDGYREAYPQIWGT
jgi:hypothetical protein